MRNEKITPTVMSGLELDDELQGESTHIQPKNADVSDFALPE